MSTLTPYAPGDALIVRFSTSAHAILTDPTGRSYTSRGTTRLVTGVAVEVVDDDGTGYPLVRRGKGLYRVHHSDLMPRPTDEQIARGDTVLRQTMVERDDALKASAAWREDYEQAQAQARALKAEVERLQAIVLKQDLALAQITSASQVLASVLQEVK